MGERVEEKQSRLQAILDSMMDGVFIVNERCEIEYANRALQRQFGPAVGLHCYNYLHDSSERCPWCARMESFVGRTSHREEMLARNQRTYDVVELPLQNTDGSLSRLVVLRDMTESKKAQQALENALDFAQNVVDGVKEALVVLNDRLEVVSANGSFYRMFGARPETTVGTPFQKVGQGRWDDKGLEGLLHELANQPARVDDYEVECEFEGTGWRTLEVTARPVATAERTGNSMVLAVEDVTARKTQERRRDELMQEISKLASTEAQETRLLHTIMENVGVQIAYLDPEFNFTRVNRAYVEGTGYEVGDLLGRNHFALFPNAENQAIFEHVRDTGKATSFHDRPFEFPNQPERGTTYWDWTLTPVRDGEGKVQGLVLTLRETTQRKRAENAMWESQRRFQRLIESNVIGMLVADAEGRVVEANDAFLDVIGYSRKDLESGAIDWYRITPEEYRQADEDAVEELMTSGSSQPFEKEYLHKDGRRIPVLLGSALWDNTTENPTWVSFVVDMTEQKETEEKLVAYERLAVLGSLAGGISHELRNPLATIDSSVYYVKSKLRGDMQRALGGDGKVQAHLERIENSVDRCTAIIQSLTDLTQMKEPKRARLDLGHVVRKIVDHYQLPRASNIDLVNASGELWIYADEGQLQMAFENVMKNGIEAMDGEGMLAVEVRKAEDGQAEIRFTDSGVGIPQEKLDKVFEPLFSTKSKGIGFGLSIAKMVAERHGGDIQAESAPGRGSTVTFRLPLVTERGTGR